MSLLTSVRLTTELLKIILKSREKQKLTVSEPMIEYLNFESQFATIFTSLKICLVVI